MAAHVLTVLALGRVRVLSSNSSSIASIHHAANGDLLIDSSPGQRVLINGVDVLALCTEAYRLASAPPSAPPPVMPPHPELPPSPPPPAPPPPPPTPSAPPASGDPTLVVNIASDIGAVNLYSYSTPGVSCSDSSCSSNFGLPMSSLASQLTTRTIVRLECVDSQSTLMTMFVRGITNFNTILFATSGTADTSIMECSHDASFLTSVTTGSACMSHNSNGHRYYQVPVRTGYNGNKAMMWALYNGGGSQSLRHCSVGTPGNGGSTHYTGRVFIM